MSLLLFGVYSASVKVPSITASKVVSSAPAVATVTYLTDGSGTYTDGTFDWYSTEIPNIGNQYEILAEINTPATVSFTGTIGSWLALSSARSWSLSVAAASAAGVLKISIRKLGEAQVVASGLVTFEAEVAS